MIYPKTVSNKITTNVVLRNQQAHDNFAPEILKHTTMKNSTIYFTAIFLLITVNIAQSQQGWTQLNFNFDSPYGHISVSPDGKIFTYKQYINETYEAMLSTDGGNTWTQVHDDRFEVAYFNSQEHLFACRQKKVQGVSTYYPHKLFLTTDNGNNWTTIDTAASNPQQVEGSVFRMDNRGTLYNGFRDLAQNTGGFNYSTDDGSSWTYVPTFIDSQYDYRRPFSALLTSQNDLFITTYNSGIFKSTDGGTTWTNVYTSFVSLGFLNEHPTTGDLYAASYSAVLKSSDNGESWDIVEPDPWFAMNITEFEITPDGTFYFAGMGGVFESNNGVNWTLLWDPAAKAKDSGVKDMAISNDYVYVLAEDSIIYSQLRSGAATGFINNYENKMLNIYPNPASAEITLEIIYNKISRNNFELNIIDISGKIVYRSTLSQNSIKHKVDVSDFNPGYYLVSLNDGINISFQKLVITK